MPSYQFFKQELELCTISSEGFRVLSRKILASLDENEVSFFKTFLKEISSLITSKQQTPISRFYALYLLFKASLDLKSEFLLELLKDTALLTFVYHTAQYESSRRISLDERGSGFFGASHTAKSTSRVGINFVRLCLEMIIFWDQKYVSKKTPEHPSHMFHLYVKGVAKKLKLPLFYYFIEKPYDLSQDLATWDFSLKLPSILPAEETQSNIVEDQRDQDDDQFSSGSLPDNTIFELKRSLSMQPQEVFSSSALKEEEDSHSEPDQTKPNLLKEEIPLINVARHQSEPPHLVNQVTCFQNWQDLEEEKNVFSVAEQRIPSSATLARTKHPHFTLGSFKNLAKSDVCQKTKLLSDLDEIEMSIKRSMNSSTKTQTSTTVDENNQTPEKCRALVGLRLTSPRPATVPPQNNSSLASLKLVSPQSVKNSKPAADDDENNKPLNSARKCFNFLKKDTIIPSYSSIWDKEDTNLSSARSQRETITTPIKPPLLKKSASIVPNSLADLELMLGRDSSQKEQPAYGRIAIIHKTTSQPRRENPIIESCEKKKYDPFARERLVEPSHL